VDSPARWLQPGRPSQREFLNSKQLWEAANLYQTDTVISHPNVAFYDFYAAWTAPIEADKDAYLNKRTGILAQAAPNIGPMFWEEIKGADGIVRQLQWTARVEGSFDTPNGSMSPLSFLLQTKPVTNPPSQRP
jgi:hypothetical protein